MGLKLGIWIVFVCLGGANLSPVAQAGSASGTNSDPDKGLVSELVELTVQQSHLWAQMQQQGKYEDALKLSSGTEKKLNDGLQRLETTHVEEADASSQPQRLNNIARLKYALSLVYYQQAGSYSKMGTAYQLRSDSDKATPLLKDSALLMLKSWELLQANAPVIGEKIDPAVGLQVLWALLDVANSYQLQDQLQAAQPLLEQSRALLEQSTLPMTELWLYYIQLASGYQQQGNFRQAEHYYQALISRASPDLPVDLPLARVYLAQLYQKQQRYVEAEQQFQLSLQQERTRPADHKRTRPIALFPLASLYMQQQAYAKAEPLLQQALAAYKQATTPDSSDLETMLDSIIHLGIREMLGNALLQLGKADAARELFLQNIHTPNTLPPISPGSKASNQENLARLYEKGKNFPEALRWLQQAWSQYEAYPGDNPEQANQARALARYRLWLLHLGVVHQQVAEANALPDVLRTMQQAHGNQRTQALRQTALRLSAATPEIRERLHELWGKQAKLAQLDLSYAESLARETITDIEQLQQTLQQTRQEIHTLDRQLQQTFPLYSQLINPAPLTLEHIQHLLKPDEALLMWVLSEHAAKSWLLVIRSDRTPALHALDTSETVLQTVLNAPGNGLLAALSDPSRRFNLQAAHGLYKTLFAPALNDLAGVRHIFAIPDGAMQNMPLHVLIKTAPSVTHDTNNYAQADWLMQHYAFSYLPSVQALANLRDAPTPAAPALPSVSTAPPQPFIGFGDALLHGQPNSTPERSGALLTQLNQHLVRGQDGFSYLATPNLLSQHLPALPDTAEELQHIASTLQVAPQQSLFLGKDATEGRLKRLDREGILSRTRILSFATHALLPPDNTQNALLNHMEPGLVLTPPDSGSVNDDGYLSASEIASLTLHADWVVLSACNTGTLQAQTAHQGLSELVRAFFLAGAKSVVASHWPVHSKATEQLIGELFSIWQKQPEKGRAEALRLAMKAMLQQAADCGWLCRAGLQTDVSLTHPAYWAAFVIYGEGGGG